MNHGSHSWKAKVLTSLVLLLAIALGARVVFELLAPLVPAIAALLALLAIFWLILGRRR
jgi:hypothetical protein